jgi:cytochrome c biogenesis factor
MSVLAATIILLIATVLALVVTAPLLYFLRKNRKKPTSAAPAQTTQSLTVIQALPGILVVIALFFAFAMEYIAPHSWLGQRITTMEGRFWFTALVWLALFAVARAVRSFR